MIFKVFFNPCGVELPLR